MYLQGRGPIRSVVINGVSVDIPEDKLANYASTENGESSALPSLKVCSCPLILLSLTYSTGLSIFCKEDKKATGDDEGTENFLHVPFRLRAQGQLLEATIDNLGANVFNLDNHGITVYPIRGLLPDHPETAGSIGKFSV